MAQICYDLQLAAAANSKGPLILVVDDEPSVVRSITTTLAMAGFRAIVAENGAGGLEAFLSQADQIDLVLADVVMPFMDGVTMAQEIRKVKPKIPILLMSAYSDKVVSVVNGATFPLIRKPFLPTDLLRAVKAQLDPPKATA